jgi:type II secretory pathway pseudopilin PulG
MKTIPARHSDRITRPVRMARAFSITELLTVVAIFSLLVIGMVATQLFGMRMYNISQTKLTLTANARKVLNHVRDEVRAGQVIAVGNADSSSFTGIADNTPRAGNALKICASAANTNQFVYYFLDTTNACLKRVTSANPGKAEIIADHLSNTTAFQAEDCQGNVVLNDQGNEIIQINLSFQQWEYPSTLATNGAVYGYYQLQTSVSPRVN